MDFWALISRIVSGVDTPDMIGTDINPATCLPMIGGIGGIDVAGNPYGLDLGQRQSADYHAADWASSTSQDHWNDPQSCRWIGGGHGDDW